MGGQGGGEGRGHKPEAHKRFIVAVGSRWGGLEGPACSVQPASWLERRPGGRGGRKELKGRPSDGEAEDGTSAGLVSLTP